MLAGTVAPGRRARRKRKVRNKTGPAAIDERWEVLLPILPEKVVVPAQRHTSLVVCNRCNRLKIVISAELRRSGAADEIIEHAPESCPSCGKPLCDAPVTRFDGRQVFDIPPPQLRVTEHRALVKTCSCGCAAKGVFPAGVTSKTQYGDRISAVSVYLSAVQFIPEDRLQEALRDLFGITPATATLATMTQEAASRVDATVERIKASITSAAVKHLDETGFRIGGKTRWMHVASTETLTHYRPDEKRGSLPDSLKGVVVHDHWKPYYKLGNVTHALCNAHHLRELKALVEIEKESCLLYTSDAADE